MKTCTVSAISLALLLGAGVANATTLGGIANVDNAFSAYISTDDSVLGTLIGSGSDWPTTTPFNTVLTPGVTQYLHIVAVNGGGPGGFLGELNLSDSLFHFSNGGQLLETDTTNWKVSLNASPGSVAWVTPTETPLDEGLNGVGPWGLRSGYTGQPTWIWSAADNGSSTLNFSTTLVSAVPLPGPLALLTSALGVSGLFGIRRRKTSKTDEV